MTERLTETYPCNKCNVEFCSRQCYSMTRWAESAKEKLAEYETAEEEGRLMMLPCKVGDIIFCIVRPGIIRQFKVLSIEIYEYGAILELLYAGNVEKYRFWRMYMPSDDFGKKLFLTSEEAEKALKKREEKKYE